MKNSERRYPHDCDCCTFLMEFKEYDLYVSESCNLGIKTVIARYGSNGEYLSGWDSASPVLVVAQAIVEYLEQSDEQAS